MDVPLKDKIYVLLQLILFLVWLLSVKEMSFIVPENLRWLALIGAGIGLMLVLLAILQLNTNLSPFPSPKEGAQLITTGVFAFARHPIYTGTLFMAFGLSIWFNSGFKVVVSVLLSLVFYFKSRYEEKQLQEHFPQYTQYQRQTGRFFPKFKGRI